MECEFKSLSQIKQQEWIRWKRVYHKYGKPCVYYSTLIVKISRNKIDFLLNTPLLSSHVLLRNVVIQDYVKIISDKQMTNPSV